MGVFIRMYEKHQQRKELETKTQIASLKAELKEKDRIIERLKNPKQTNPKKPDNS